MERAAFQTHRPLATIVARAGHLKDAGESLPAGTLVGRQVADTVWPERPTGSADEETTSTAVGKGTTSYGDLVAGDEVNGAAAWTYPQPPEAAKRIAGYFALWSGVKAEK